MARTLGFTPHVGSSWAVRPTPVFAGLNSVDPCLPPIGRNTTTEVPRPVIGKDVWPSPPLGPPQKPGLRTTF